jgi:hypothetical protein
MFDVNFKGPVILTNLIFDYFANYNFKWIFIASDAHQIGDLDFDDFDKSKKYGNVKPSVVCFVPLFFFAEKSC